MAVRGDMTSCEVPLRGMKEAHVRTMLNSTAEVHINLRHCTQLCSLLIAILHDIHITPVRERSGRRRQGKRRKALEAARGRARRGRGRTRMGRRGGGRGGWRGSEGGREVEVRGREDRRARSKGDSLHRRGHWRRSRARRKWTERRG